MSKSNFISSNVDCQIEWANPKKKRIRRVVRRSNARTTGKYPSWKTGRMIQYESSIERDGYKLFDADPEINSFYEQVARLTFCMDGQRHIHYPDSLVISTSGNRFIEIKDEEDIKDPFVIRRAEYLSAILPLYGLGYELLGEEEIRRQPRLGNVEEILALGKKIRVDEIARETIRRTFTKTPKVFVGDIREGLFGEKGAFSVARLILEGVLTIDYDIHWDEDTVITLVEAGG